MQGIKLSNIFIVAAIEVIFLLIAFIMIGFGMKELKKGRNRLNNILLVSLGLAFVLVSLYCARILLLY